MAATPKYHHGFEQYAHDSYGATNVVNQSTLSRTGSYSFYCDLDHSLGGVNSVSFSSYNTRYGNVREAVCAFYIYIYAYPSGGDGKASIFEWKQSAEANSFGGLALRSDGLVEMFAYGSGLVATAVATSSLAIPLQTWTRIDMGVKLNTITVQPAPNPPYETSAAFCFAINHQVQGTWTPSTSDGPTGPHITNLSSYIIGYEHLGLEGGSLGSYCTATRGIAAFDDVCIGEGSSYQDFLPDNLHTITLSGNGVGNYTGWGLTATTKEYVSNEASQAMEYDLLVAEDFISSSSALDQFSVTVPSPTTRGVPVNTNLYSPYVCVQSTAPWSARVLLRVDGVDNWSAAITLDSASYSVASFPGVTITPSSSIEIGVEKDNSATTRRIVHLFLGMCAEEVRPEPRGAAIEVVAGSYTGNGTAQEITTGINADYMFVLSCAGGSSRYWTLAFRTPTGSPYFSMPVYDGFLFSDRQFRFTSTGFVPVGSGVNDSGVTYFVVAFKDPRYRMLRLAIGKMPGAGHPDYPNAEVEYPWYETPFTTSAPKYVAMVHPSITGSINAFERYPFHVGDQSKIIGDAVDASNDEAGAIVSFGATSATIGQAGGTGSSRPFMCFGLCDDVFYFNQLIVVGSYIGTGSGPRQVDLPDSFADKTPCIIWGCPSPTSGISSAEYDFVWTEAFAAGASMRKNNGVYNTANRGVSGVGAGYFTLYDQYYNEAGVTYNYVAIAEGVDEPGHEIASPVTPGPVNQCPWGEDDSPTCDPIYPQWPDDLPGLLGVIVGIRRYNAPNVPIDARTYKVPCEQRTFPVEEEQRVFDVPCEQRTFDALSEYP